MAIVLPPSSAIVDGLIQKAKEEGKLSDEVLLLFHEMFSQTFEAALEIIDKGLITWVEAHPSGRAFYLIEGKKPASHVCFGHYCSCPSFTYNVINRADSLYCKHQLAAKLVEIYPSKLKKKEITDTEYVEAVQSETVNH